MRQALVEIITIGDEILFGQITDTNSQWMGAELDKLGFKTIRKTTVGDVKEEILTAFAEAEARADILLITGGLGPTNDDLTKPCLAEYFDCDIAMHAEAFAHLSALFASRGFPMTDTNKLQAALPTACEPILNQLGSASGMWFAKGEKVFVSMPGVPYEMKAMMSNDVLPRLLKQFDPPVVIHKMIKTAGIGESWLADKIQNWEAALPKHIKLAYLPSTGRVRLRLTGIGENREILSKEIADCISSVLPIIDKYVVGFDSESIESMVGKLLMERGKNLSVAESCTGGFIGHKITAIPGSSAYFKGGIISYANEVKINELGVDSTILEKHGAVSEEVVTAMAEGVAKKLSTTYALATSGIAGPDGGTEEKPVGTIWIACTGPEGTRTRLLHLGKDRLVNISYTATAALTLLWKVLTGNE